MAFCFTLTTGTAMGDPNITGLALWQVRTPGVFFAMPFYTRNDLFTKTGSGQT
jgi:hypothetical protein